MVSVRNSNMHQYKNVAPNWQKWKMITMKKGRRKLREGRARGDGRKGDEGEGKRKKDKEDDKREENVEVMEVEVPVRGSTRRCCLHKFLHVNIFLRVNNFLHVKICVHVKQ